MLLLRICQRILKLVGLKPLSLAWHSNPAIPVNEQKNDYLLRLLQWDCIYISSFNSHHNHVQQELPAPFYRWRELGPTKNQMTEQREPTANKWHGQEFSVFFYFTTPRCLSPTQIQHHYSLTRILCFCSCLVYST